MSTPFLARFNNSASNSIAKFFDKGGFDMGTNVLVNPELKGFTTFREFVDKSGNKGWMEHPNNWEFIFTPMHPDDPNRVAQSLHRDQGFVIAAGFRKWEGGYVQRGVRLRKGQRYLAKAIFTPHVGFSDTRPDDWRTHIQWHFIFEGNGQKLESNWSSTSRDGFGHDEEHMMVIEPLSDMVVNYAFMAQSRWESNSCDFHVKQLALEEVPSDYGMPTYLGTPSSQPEPTSPPSTLVTPSDDSPKSPTRGQATLEDLMTDDDIDTIAKGFRAAAGTGMFNETITAGFARWADVLERFKNTRTSS